MPCTTRPRQTLFALLTKLECPIAVWLAGLARISQKLPGSQARDCEELCQRYEKAVRYLVEEQEINSQTPAASALIIIFDYFEIYRDELAKVLASADREQDRAALLAQFTHAVH